MFKRRSPVSLGGSRGVKDMGAIRERWGNDVIIKKKIKLTICSDQL